MFNPEKLLGQLMGDAMSGKLGGGKRKQKRGSSGLGGLLGGGGGLGGLLGGGGSRSGGGMLGGMSGGTKAKLGLGLLGIAVAAYQHYQQPAAPQPVMGGAMPPPPPMGLGSAAPPPPPPPAAAPSPARVEHAMHLLRAMITAAHADGLIDADEREAVLGRAREAGLDAESLQALDAEIRSPLNLEQLAVRTPAALRAEVYAAALIAITADTEQERAFLDRLAGQLGLDGASRADIHAQLGVDDDA